MNIFLIFSLMKSKLFFGDNLDILKSEKIPKNSVDLIYLDPPFNSNLNYNVLFKTNTHQDSAAQIQAFEDTWEWGKESLNAYEELKDHGDIFDLMEGLFLTLKESNIMAYLVMMTLRLVHLHNVLKETGSLYLHCDPTASHYLKLILDKIFGPTNFKNEIIWKRTHSHSSSKRWGPIHDTIFFYTKSDAYTWNSIKVPYTDEYIKKTYNKKDKNGSYNTILLTGPGTRTGESGKSWRGINPTKIGRHWAVPLKKTLPDWVILPPDWDEIPPLTRLDLLDEKKLIYWPKKENGTPLLKKYLTENMGVALQDIINDIPPLGPTEKERLGYPTQKPVSLLERIIRASSNEGDLVLDPFCGCGTTIVASHKLKRNYLGIDITHLAMGLLEYRMNEEFNIRPTVYGVPKSFESALDLFNRNPFQFEAWAVTRIKGIHPNKKQVGDKGIDGMGRIGPNKQYKILVSVKGGKNIGPSMIRDLAGAVDREKAHAGILILLHKPTKGMNLESLSYGYMDTPLSNHKFLKIQIYTIEDYFNGKLVELPVDVQF